MLQDYFLDIESYLIYKISRYFGNASIAQVWFFKVYVPLLRFLSYLLLC